MGTRFRRDAVILDEDALKRLAQLAYRGRSLSISGARVRRVLQAGERLGMTAGDTVVLAIETLQEIDQRGEFVAAMEAVLDAFDSGRLITGIREPLNLYLDRSAVAALAAFTCEQCRPNLPVRHLSGAIQERSRPVLPVSEEAPARSPAPEGTAGSLHADRVEGWPERTGHGHPQMTLDVLAWWPGLDRWEELTMVASVTRSRAATGDNFLLRLGQPGDQQPAEVGAIWLVRRPDLTGAVPVFEVRGSRWQPGDEDPHLFRFLVASASEWCAELHDYLATRWISRGRSPSGPDDFSEPLARPPIDPPSPARQGERKARNLNTKV